MKIVIDTNVLINGFKDEYSFEKRIIDAVRNGEITAFANRQTINENRLLSSQLIDNDAYQKELKQLFEKINWVENKRLIRAVRDPQDNKILESAVEAKADFLVTSDNDLLVLQKFGPVRIINPSQFWSEFKDEGMDLWKQWANFLKS